MLSLKKCLLYTNFFVSTIKTHRIIIHCNPVFTKPVFVILVTIYTKDIYNSTARTKSTDVSEGKSSDYYIIYKKMEGKSCCFIKIRM